MKNNRSKTVRAICLLLLVATVFSVALTSCGEEKAEKKTQVTTSAQSSDGESVTDSVKQRYAGNDFEEYEFKILGIESGEWWYGGFMSDSFNEIWYETDSSDPLESAIYTRNRRTEDLLNIRISPVWGTGSYDTAERVRTAVETGDTDYDIVLSNLTDTLNLAMEGYVANFKSIDTLDLTNDWWDHNMVDAFTLFTDRLYVLAGDINVYDDMSILFYLFNKDMAEQMNMGDIYQYVRDNNWTIDTFATLCRMVYQDNDNGDETDDTYGSNLSSGLYHGFGLPITVTDSEGVPQLAVEGEAYVNAALKLFNTVIESKFNTPANYLNSDTGAQEEAFFDGHILFYSILTCQLNRMRNTDTEFGVMPLPKLNASQTNYSHYVNQVFFSAYFIPSFNQNLDRTGLIMDVLGGFSTDTVYETEFGTLMGYDSKLLRDNDSKDMLDIVMSSRKFDYSILGLGDIEKCFEMDKWSTFMYSSAVNTYKKTANALLNRYINAFSELS